MNRANLLLTAADMRRILLFCFVFFTEILLCPHSARAQAQAMDSTEDRKTKKRQREHIDKNERNENNYDHGDYVVPEFDRVRLSDKPSAFRRPAARQKK